MKWLLITSSIAFLLLTASTVAQAQSGVPVAPVPTASEIMFSGGISPGEVTATPEMWFYQQELRRYENPKTAVRQKAEFEAVQRRQRIAARRWFGFSNARPMASVDPIHGDYSPSWTGSDRYHPFRWTSPGPAVIVARPISTVRTY
jgi:hypothetical protein